ncbi:hypothetical protein BBK82_03405 [Lentzea guizhouensis]|uniref:GH29D-like beta-sandwich domain-containing protein n=1 Tax=Lentzea guizhouensis TaxID=1586287 RepID=A0A1B2HC31_9PSEU|nr:chitobiase/beta-hexosaminidase C-terminal domain-containing protein [Lentzea guizhouensis]ANZ35262.1 hypothetical protein BBK82_03405 [Lentzea guizhouensis]
MSTLTTRLQLVKETNAENYSVGTVNNNSDKIDAAVGFEECTSSTRPSSPYNGKGIRESDTGSVLLSNGTVPASGSWKYLWSADGPVIVGAVGASAPLRGQTTGFLTGTRLLDARKYGEANPGFTIDFDGKHQWGPGGVTAPDTNLYRSTTDLLRTDDSFYVGGALTVVGAVTLTGAVSGPVARGLVRRGRRSTSSTGTTSIVGVLRLGDSPNTIPVVSGRAYRISAVVHPRSTIAGDRILTEIRYTTDGSAPSTSSTVLAQKYSTAFAVSSADSDPFETVYEPATSHNLRLLLTISRGAGTGTVEAYADATASTELVVEDVGLAVTNTGVSV